MLPKIRMPAGSARTLRDDGFVSPHVGDAVWAAEQQLRFAALAAGLLFMQQHPAHAPPKRNLATERDSARRLVQWGLHHNPESERWSYTCFLTPDGFLMDDTAQYPDLSEFFDACRYMTMLARNIGIRTAVALQRAKMGGDAPLCPLFRRGTVAFRYMRFPIKPGVGRSKTEPTSASLGILLGAENGHVEVAGMSGADIPAIIQRNPQRPIIMPGLGIEARDPRIKATRHRVRPRQDHDVEIRSTAKAYFMDPPDARIALPQDPPQRSTEELFLIS